MKRSTKLVVFLVLAAILCSVLAGCSFGKLQPTIVYDKKYEYSPSAFLVFHANHTGYFEVHQNNSDHTVSSGRVDFFWRTADDGTVYLFGSETTYYDDDTSGKSFIIFSLSMPITFGDGFLIALNVTPYVNLNTAYTSVNTRKFVLEGSDLAKDLEKGIDAED